MGTEKRQKILDTAMRLFVEKGIQATATSLIAKEAGVATGTLFHHFKSKEELVNELYNSLFDSLLGYQEEHFNPDAGVRERLCQIWQLDIEWGTRHVEYSHFLERYSFFHYASEQAVQEAYERFDHCMGAFKEAVSMNLMKFDDLDYIVDHYIWNIRMNIMYFIAHPDRCTTEQINQTFDIYWSGIARGER